MPDNADQNTSFANESQKIGDKHSPLAQFVFLSIWQSDALFDMQAMTGAT